MQTTRLNAIRTGILLTAIASALALSHPVLAADKIDGRVVIDRHPGADGERVLLFDYTPLGGGRMDSRFQIKNLKTGAWLTLEGSFADIGGNANMARFSENGQEVAVDDFADGVSTPTNDDGSVTEPGQQPFYYDKSGQTWRHRIYDASTGKFLRAAPVPHPRMSSDFTRALITDKTTRVCSLVDLSRSPNATLLQMPSKYDEFPYRAEFSFHGHSLFARLSHSEAAAFDLSQTPPAKVLTFNPAFLGASLSPTFSTDGRLIAYQETLFQVAIFDLEHHKALCKFPIVRSSFVSFSPDNATVTVTRLSSNRITVRDAHTGAVLKDENEIVGN